MQKLYVTGGYQYVALKFNSNVKICNLFCFEWNQINLCLLMFLDNLLAFSQSKTLLDPDLDSIAIFFLLLEENYTCHQQND